MDDRRKGLVVVVGGDEWVFGEVLYKVTTGGLLTVSSLKYDETIAIFQKWDHLYIEGESIKRRSVYRESRKASKERKLNVGKVWISGGV